jgi:hypothetical protein
MVGRKKDAPATTTGENHPGDSVDPSDGEKKGIRA